MKKLQWTLAILSALSIFILTMHVWAHQLTISDYIENQNRLAESQIRLNNAISAVLERKALDDDLMTTYIRNNPPKRRDEARKVSQ